MHQYDRLQRILTELFHYTVMFFIVASIAAVIGSSFETMRPYRHLLFGINYLASFVFLVEYVLRIVAAPARYPGRSPFRARVRYLFSFYGAVDFVAVLPFLLVYLFKDTPSVHIITLAYIFIVFKLIRHSRSFRFIGEVLSAVREELVTAYTACGIMVCFWRISCTTSNATPSPKRSPISAGWPVVVHRGIHHGRLRRHLPDHPAGETPEQPHQSDRNRHDRHPDRYHQLVVHQPAATEKQERVTPKNVRQRCE